MSDKSAPTHPGKIVFMEGDTVTHEEDASEVPFSIRFIETPEGLVPVVKIVAVVAGNKRTIRQYGPQGQLLKSTVQVRD
jgi:hypothetical protein